MYVLLLSIALAIATPQDSQSTARKNPPLLPSLEGEDPHRWLEDVLGDKSLEWVRSLNANSTEVLGNGPEFEKLRKNLLSIYDSDERIPYVSTRGGYFYNFWRDADHKRGLWRRTTPESYEKEDPEWEILLDLDALGEKEDENWVWSSARALPPSYDRVLIELSRGGADATVTREFDVPSRSFVKGGFELPEAKGGASWIDKDTVFVSTDFGEGSMTESGYPRIAKVWKRGTPLSEAKVVFEGQVSDVAAGISRDHTPGFQRDFAYRFVTFYTNEVYEWKDGAMHKVDKPDHCDATVTREWVFFEPRSEWTVGSRSYKAGSLLAANYEAWMKGERALEVLFTPSDTTSMAGFAATRNHFILNVLDNVKNRLEVLTPSEKGWERKPLEGVPAIGQISASPVDPWESDAYWLHLSGYTTPSSLSYGVIDDVEPKTLKQLPAFFDAEGIEVSQHFARSKDGTSIPYFQVTPKAAKGKAAPTLLYGYGGFEISMLPGYSAAIGQAWLSRGGVYVVANIRGGGEFGPRWHQAALKDKRHRAYEDFAAVARDLIARGVSTREQLGIQGGSNGGLLVGNMYTLYPDLFGAVVCQVPLLDMKRYTKLLAGASWAGEYGDPDEAKEWEFIQTFSPYHNIDPLASYPPILFTTSTREDRVHPGHARKMAAALLSADKNVLYYENIEGGHGGAADNEQAAFMSALAYTFLWKSLNQKNP